VTLNREQCIGLVEIVSKSGIDVFELRSGCVELIFDRREMTGSTDGNCRYESGQFAVDVLSPVLGMCRIAPSDDAPPYVQTGQMVSEHDIICSIDVLENRFDVPAGTRGIILQLYTRSGELVEYKQQLAVIQTVG
jgi:biotin carboxyl carrier protein